MLKKLLPLCLAAALLAGCGASAQKPAEPSDAAAPPAAVTQATAEQAAPGFTVGTLHELGKIYGGEEDVIDHDAYYDAAALKQDGVGALILKTDYATGVQSPLCQRPGCTHDTIDCPAFVESATVRTRVAALGGKVYVTNSAALGGSAMERDLTPKAYPNLTPEGEADLNALNAADAVPSYVDVFSADGMTRTRLAERTEELGFNWCDERAIYALHTSTNLNDPVYMLRVDLADGTCSTVTLPRDAKVAGVVGNRFLLYRVLSDQDLNALAAEDYDTYLAAKQSATEEYDLWDMATDELETVYTYGSAETRSVMGAYNGRLYVEYWTVAPQKGITEAGKITEINLADGSERTLMETRPEKEMSAVRFMPLGLPEDGDTPRGFLWMRGTIGKYSYDSSLYLIDLQNGNANLITQRAMFQDYAAESTPSPIAQTNDGRWLIAVGSVSANHNARNRYGLIDPAAYLAGSEEYQLVDMYEPDGT